MEKLLARAERAKSRTAMLKTKKGDIGHIWACDSYCIIAYHSNISIYIDIYTHVYTHTHVYIYIYIHVYTCVHIYVGMVWYGMVWHGMAWYGNV